MKDSRLAGEQLSSTPGWHGHDLGLGLQGKPPHADEVLRDLRQPLLVLVHQELRPVCQVLIDLLQGLGIASLQPAALQGKGINDTSSPGT